MSRRPATARSRSGGEARGVLAHGVHQSDADPGVRSDLANLEQDVLEQRRREPATFMLDIDGEPSEQHRRKGIRLVASFTPRGLGGES